MVSRKALLIAAAAAMAVVVGLLQATASARNFLVGGLDGGWDLKVDYDIWLLQLGVGINSGDTLQFVYDVKKHNVVRVSQDGYNACDATSNLGTWNTGNDNVQLPEAGNYFFICSVADHCTRGLKLALTVF